ncbi:hypothetical protein [Aquimarina intermedia]|uniref:Acetyltransferase (GNAT) family protein n=1 Tax=Aquimarina intermedia TaxID=350814 RepID=A0A5S5BS31_9FLAO|nr:hypothetical protein [Aquimarina intermedia]TYP70005.1 hypothetical protein BD809_11415 [Aquimarina intermedia]
MLQTNSNTLRLIDKENIHSIYELHTVEAVDHYNTLGIPESIEVTSQILSHWIIKIEAA